MLIDCFQACAEETVALVVLGVLIMLVHRKSQKSLSITVADDLKLLLYHVPSRF